MSETPHSIRHSGMVVQGHRIASGQSETGKDGLNATVVKQMPFFLKAGIPGIEHMFTGTVNVNLGGYTFDILAPTHIVTCEWHPGIVETFWFVPVALDCRGATYKGYVYFPLPSEVQHRNLEVMELLMPKIEGLAYGDAVSIDLPSAAIKVRLMS